MLFNDSHVAAYRNATAKPQALAAFHAPRRARGAMLDVRDAPAYLDRMSGGGDLQDAIRINTLIEKFPKAWQARLRKSLGRVSRATWGKWRDAVLKLSEADRAGVRPDATDEDICAAADLAARDIEARLQDMRATWVGRERAEAYGPDFVEAMEALMCRELLEVRGMLDLYPQGANVSRGGAVKRLQDARWWRRALRRLHARTVEACAIDLGLVHRRAGLYVSDEAVQRRRGQNIRNAAALASVVAVNDLGQSSTLADLAAKGTANKAIRRVELLTRIAGFELIAKDLGHLGCMVTMTLPSRFHKMTTGPDGRPVRNKKYDGSTPAQGQAWLSTQWARCRAMAARCGLDWYGFRIAEPQHDGTPHWHVLLFMPQAVDGLDSAVLLTALVKCYFLDCEARDEPGAQKHRVRFNWIDWARGSAVGYVIKYVSKNIDGHGVGVPTERDGDMVFEGEDASETAARVEAWAGTWNLRQFQQVGGAPVGVWRELRRLNPDNVPDELPEAIAVAVSAVNAKGEPGVQAIAWKRYIGAQGGIGAKRASMRLQLLKGERSAADSGRVGRYGEPVAVRLLGVNAAGVQLFRNHIHEMNPAAPAFKRQHFASVESERCAWVVTQGTPAEAQAAARVVFQRSGEAASTRIHVNNCTGRDLARVSEFAPVREYRPRLRRFKRREEGKPTTQESHGRKPNPGRPAYLDEPAPF